MEPVEKVIIPKERYELMERIVKTLDDYVNAVNAYNEYEKQQKKEIVTPETPNEPTQTEGGN